MKVLFLGANMMECSPNDLFKYTQAAGVIEKWTDFLELEEKDYVLDRVSLFVKSDGSKLTNRDILYHAPSLIFRIEHVHEPTHIVALGDEAANACEILGFDYFKFYSPNDDAKGDLEVTKRLRLLKRYIGRE